MWKKKALKTEEERPKSAPVAGSKFFRTVPKPFKLSTGNMTQLELTTYFTSYLLPMLFAYY